jgi:hypothetical protein
VVHAAKRTEDTHGSIPTQIADCTAAAALGGWTVIASHSEAKSAYHRSRGDGLVQARVQARRPSDGHGEVMLAVRHTDQLARGAR